MNKYMKYDLLYKGEFRIFLLILSVYSERKTYFCFYVAIVFKDEKLFVSDFSIAVALGL